MCDHVWIFEARTLSTQPVRRPAREWLAAREAELLPVPYYHVVFTLPAAIADIAYQNKAVIYDLLFKASSETMLTIAADPKHLGVRQHREVEEVPELAHHERGRGARLRGQHLDCILRAAMRACNPTTCDRSPSFAVRFTPIT
jgi:hypothetical protein